jgi:hypothetical protein
MGLKHKAKKGTVIEANGVTVKVLRGSPQLEITAPRESSIRIGREEPLPVAGRSSGGDRQPTFERQSSSKRISRQK